MAVLSDDEFRQATVKNGGATRNLKTGKTVKVGQNAWAVGGAQNSSGNRIPEETHDVAGYTTDHVREHRRRLAAQVTDPNVNQGSWVEGSNVVHDASNVYVGKGAYRKAMNAGNARGEREIFGFKKGKSKPVVPK